MVLVGRSKLHGTVEVDEVFVGGKQSGKRGRGAEGKSIVAVEIKGRKTDRVMRLAKIPNASSEVLNGFIENNIEKSSTIVTDGWNGYIGISKIGYTHEIQSSSLKKEDDEEILPNVHRIASLLKRWLLGTHQSYLNKNKFEYYLDEYVFRYNRRTSTSRGLLFMRLIEQAVINNPVSYKEIINQNHGR